MKNVFRALTVAAALCLAALSGANAQTPVSQCQFSVTAAGTSSQVCNIDPTRMTNGAGVTLLLNFSSGASATATVQITGDNPVNPTGGFWNNHDTLVNETGSANGNIQFPVTAVRLNVTAYASGTITLTVIQPAIPKN